MLFVLVVKRAASRRFEVVFIAFTMQHGLSQLQNPRYLLVCYLLGLCLKCHFTTSYMAVTLCWLHVVSVICTEVTYLYCFKASSLLMHHLFHAIVRSSLSTRSMVVDDDTHAKVILWKCVASPEPLSLHLWIPLSLQLRFGFQRAHEGTRSLDFSIPPIVSIPPQGCFYPPSSFKNVLFAASSLSELLSHWCTTVWKWKREHVLEMCCVCTSLCTIVKLSRDLRL